MQPNIALAGFAGAGKTTLANALARHGYRRRSFADVLKALACQVLGRDLDKARDRALLQDLGAAGRHPDWAGLSLALQVDPIVRPSRQATLVSQLALHLFGTPTDPAAWDTWWEQTKRLEVALFGGHPPMAAGFGRPGYWIEQLVGRLHPLDGPYVIDDMRFLNEAAALRSRGFRLVRLDVSELEAAQRLLQRDGSYDPGLHLHPSEQAHRAIDFDLVLPSNFTPGEWAELILQESARVA